MEKQVKADARSGDDDSERGEHVHLVKGDLPHRSDDCAEMKLDGECISDEKAVEVLEQKSDDAIEKLMQAEDAEQKVEAQEDLAQISEQRIEKVNDDLDEIRDLIQQKKAAGKMEGLEELWGPYNQEGVYAQPDPPNQQQPLEQLLLREPG